MTVSEIKLKDVMPNTLDTRESASQLVQLIREEYLDAKIELDFTDILFMSRSFADQFHKEIHQLDSELDLVLKNADIQITEILNAVSITQTKRKKVLKNYVTLQFNDLKKLNDYTFSW